MGKSDFLISKMYHRPFKRTPNVDWLKVREMVTLATPQLERYFEIATVSSKVHRLDPRLSNAFASVEVWLTPEDDRRAVTLNPRRCTELTERELISLAEWTEGVSKAIPGFRLKLKDSINGLYIYSFGPSELPTLSV